jgi:hypothetical protein
MPVKKTTKTGKTIKKSLKKTKKTKKPMPAGFAWCMKCHEAVRMTNVKVKTNKNGRKQLVGMLDCNHHIGHRFIK